MSCVGGTADLPSMTESLLPLCGLAHASSTSFSLNFSQLPTLQRIDFPVFLHPCLPPFLLIRDVGAGPALLGGERKGVRLHNIHHLSYCMYMLRRVKLPHSLHLQIEEAFILASTHANDSVFAPITQFTH